MTLLEFINTLEEVGGSADLAQVIIGVDGKVYDVESVEAVMDGQATPFIRVTTKER